MTADELRDWDEYLAWTRNAAPGQYEITEERAWSRLQVAAMRRRLAPYRVRPPREQLALPRGSEETTSRPEGGSDAIPEGGEE